MTTLEVDRRTDRQTDGWTVKQMGGQANRWVDKQTHKWTDRRVERQTIQLTTFWRLLIRQIWWAKKQADKDER